MRLASDKIDHLKTAIKAIMPTAKIYLFGSRVDDSKKGGDIDLLILGERTLAFSEKALIERDFCKASRQQKLELVSFEINAYDVLKASALNEAIEL